jgi:L-arabinokinase
MRIVFYISGHGFGHASRDVEVMNVLGQDPAVSIEIRSAVDPDLLARTMRVPYTLEPGPVDTGIIQSSSVAHDDEATIRVAQAFYRTFDGRVRDEARALSSRAVEVIVADIAPLGCAVAAALGVPGVAMGNFTWDWIYDTHPGFLPSGAGVVATIRAAYRQASLALQLPFSAGFDVFPRSESIPLVARRPTRGRAETRAFFGLPAEGRVALVSFGGYGLASLDLDAVDAGPDWTIATTTSTAGDERRSRHVVLLDERLFRTSGFRYEDLVAAADVVVTKPGYGIIAECIAGGTAMVYTSRGAFREYDLLVEALPRHVRARFLSQPDLFAGRWREALEGALAEPQPPEQLETNGAEVAAELIRRAAAFPPR